jgi:hypothetical protein
MTRKELEARAERISQEIADRNKKGFADFMRRGHQALADWLKAALEAMQAGESFDHARTIFSFVRDADRGLVLKDARLTIYEVDAQASAHAGRHDVDEQLGHGRSA